MCDVNALEDEPRRPAPVLTDDNVVFWDAAAAGRLVAQRCGACGVLRHPPRPMCPHCSSLAVDVVDLAGTGTVYSWAVLHHPQHPAFDYPLPVALVDLDEGVRVVSNLVGVAPDAIRVGMRVAVELRPTLGERAVPVFRPVEER
jgi:uncharacterized OB-fold protein